MKKIISFVLVLIYVISLSPIYVKAEEGVHQSHSVIGKVFIDENSDGVFDEKDKVLKDQVVDLYEENSITIGENVTITDYSLCSSTITDNSGNYSFQVSHDKKYYISLNGTSMEQVPYAVGSSNFLVINGYPMKSTDLFYCGEKLKKPKLEDFLSELYADTFTKIIRAFEEGYIDRDTEIKYLIKALKKEEPELYKSTVKAKSGTFIINTLLEYIEDPKNDENIAIMAADAIIDNYNGIIQSDWDDPEYETTNFRIFYSTSDSLSIHYINPVDTDSSGYPDAIEFLGDILEDIYSNSLTGTGLRRPFEDPFLGTVAKIKVYVGDCGTAGGWTIPYADLIDDDIDAYFNITDSMGAKSIVICIDKNYVNYANTQSLKSIAAHEFFHGIQWAYINGSIQVWWSEGCSNYGKTLAYSSGTDYASNVASYYADTSVSLTNQSGKSCVFIEYLDGLYSGNTIAEILELMGTINGYYSNQNMMEVLEYFIQQKNSNDSLDDVFRGFAATIYENGQDQNVINTYPDTFAEACGGYGIEHIKYNATQSSQSKTLTVTIDASDQITWGAALYEIAGGSSYKTDYSTIINNSTSKILSLEVPTFGTGYNSAVVELVNYIETSGNNAYMSTAYEICNSAYHSWVVANDCETRTCSLCSLTEDDGDYHSPGEWVTEPGDEPNCVETGTAKQYCTRCNELLDTTVLPTNSNHLLGTLHVCTTAYCNTTGYKHQHCLREYCSYTTNPVPYYDPNNHTWPSSWTVIDQPTCYETGTEVKKCTRCQDVLDTRSIPATGNHVYNGTQVIIYPETCTTSGKTKIYCSTSGCSSYTYIYPPATGHINTTLTVFSIDKTYSTCPYTRYTYDERCDACHEWMENYSYTNVYTGHVMGSWYFWYDYWDDMIFDYVNVYRKDCSICDYYQTYED